MTFTIKVDTGPTIRALQQTMRDQVPFAVATALTRTAKAVERELPAALERSLDRPTEFTKRGTFVRAATKTNLQAVVGFRPIQSGYLRYQIEGGVRQPNRKALRLPAAIGLDAFGNIPRGIIARLLAVAKREGKLTRRQSRRIKVSSKVEIFYGDPRDLGAKQFPPGIYKRLDEGGGRHRLIPLIVFPVRSARYRKRFDFEGLSSSVVQSQWPRILEESIAYAQATAR